MKISSLREAIATYVHDGDVVALEGFTHAIPFGAGHEIMRQGRRDLTLCRLTPDLLYDQMVAAGCAGKLVFSYLGNPGVGSLHCIRRALEWGVPHPVEIEEYSHFGMVARYTAGATGLPFFPLRSYVGSDLPGANPRIQFIKSPYDDSEVAVVPLLKPDVTILHAPRADRKGNTQFWGLLGVQKEAAFAARHVIVTVEEIVDEGVIRSDPNRTLIPHLIVDAVVPLPRGAHPAYVQGYYDRDGEFYLEWDGISREPDRTAAWLDEWVHGVADWDGYLAKLETREPGIWERLGAGCSMAEPVNYGAYS